MSRLRRAVGRGRVWRLSLCAAVLWAGAGWLPEEAAAQVAPAAADLLKAGAVCGSLPARPRPCVTIAPYAWLSGLSGETGVRDLSADVDQSFTDILSHLRFAAMATAEVDYGRWMGILDGVYSSVRVPRTLSRGRIQPELDFTSKMLIAQALLGYSVLSFPDERVTIDLLGGARLWNARASLSVSGDLASRKRSIDRTWVDAIGGARVRWSPVDQWTFAAAGNAGGGGSRRTVEGMASAGYDLSRRWSLFAAYRYLYDDRRRDDHFFKGHLAGPVVGGAYHW